jgi:hypothetical protein
VMRRLLKVATVVALLFTFSLELCVPARGQLIGVGRARGRRVGRVVLPTPPFNPDAGILDSPKGRGHNHTPVVPRRRVNHSKHSYSQSHRRHAPRRRGRIR